MTPNNFINTYSPHALISQQETEVPAIAQLAQAAFESAWGEKAIGNNFFGIKYRKGDYGYRQVLTTEYMREPTSFKGENIKSVVYDKETGLYVYKVWQYFADYPTPKEGFLAHARLLLTDRYKHCLRWKDDPKRYLIAVWQAGYATDPNYKNKISLMVDSVIKRLPKEVEDKYIRETIRYMGIIKKIEPKLFEIPKKVELEQKLLNRTA